MLPEDVLQKYRKAGKIASEIRRKVPSLVREGTPIIDICNRVETMIREMGGKPAFPCNVCINETAAHYTPPPYDIAVIPEGAVVKVDIGVHVDGYIADTATTLCFNQEYSALLEVVENALYKACEVVKPGRKASEIGGVVQKEIETHGFKPIWNLNGHKVSRYLIHAGKSIPNVSFTNGTKIEADEVYAIEPFLTFKSAAGRVKNGTETYIFRYLKDRTLKSDGAKQLLRKIKTEFRTLPFAKRWIYDALPKTEFESAFSEILSSKAIMAYPVLVEASGNLVAQAEHTVVVTKRGCMILTS